MSEKTVRVGAELDEETAARLNRWARREGRSKRRQAAVLLRKLTALATSHAPDLERLGLLERSAG